MRIQHNIAAMNSYRNYNNNASALSKNLEKLSSGYKINRAGDDAAGLAISEKMRAQITGLETATKNVKDGISLVKTAEGATQEIHDMLNRMEELATQSANGTYDDGVDRQNLQKEVTALRTEIDRIASTANFNGIKLLDGTWDNKTTVFELVEKDTLTMLDAYSKSWESKIGGKLADTETIEIDGITFTAKSTSPDASKNEIAVGADVHEQMNSIVALYNKNDEANYTAAYNKETGKLTLTAKDTTNTKAAVINTGSSAITATSPVEVEIDKAGKKATFSVDLNVTSNQTFGANLAGGNKVTIGDYTFTNGTSTSSPIAAANLAGSIVSDLTTKNNGELTINNQVWTVTNSGSKLVFTQKEAKDIDLSDSTTATAIKNAFKDNSGTSVASKVTLADTKNGKDALIGEDLGGLLLQIGDTSDKDNKLGVSIASLMSDAMKIDTVDVSTQPKASDAINTIKVAINYVSSVRGDLGAVQNRLEHTSNNLSVMTENIQDAESTIRDTDVADEMTTYTKNNILLQSAQAMLAQANQVPQGVLQLMQ